jgi:hypothetical protein
MIEFIKEPFEDVDDPANQDLIVPGVAITRGDSQGIYNAALEDFYTTNVSPMDTEWAFLTNNDPGASIEASAFAQLSFDPWQIAVGNRPPDRVGEPAVLHIISADIYLDVMFTSWGQGAGAGGSFTYMRATEGAADRDQDGFPDAEDVCPDWPDDQTDTDENGIGDACECGDQNGDGTVDVSDILAVNAAIFDPPQVTPLCDANDDGVCDVGDILAINAKIFGAMAFCEQFPSMEP